MNRVYLDWGVISNLKKAEFAELRDFLLSHKGELFYVYSPAHFYDALRSDDKERLEQDIKTLESLVDDHLIAYNQIDANAYKQTPSEYYRLNKDTINDLMPDFNELVSDIENDYPDAGRRLKALLNMRFPITDVINNNELLKMMLPGLPVSPTFHDVIKASITYVDKMQTDNAYYKAYRSKVREKGFALEPNSGNWETQEVIPNISSLLKTSGIDKSFKEVVLSGFNNKKPVDRFSFFVAAYGMLDMLGYKSDKLSKSINAMNSVTTDAQHAYYAAFCDYFVTQDKRLACKAKALYSELGISTKIISPVDVVNFLGGDSKDDFVVFLEEQLIEENVTCRESKNTVYRLSKRFLGIFSHCLKYKHEDSTILEFRLFFDNYSYFLYFDEVRYIIDSIAKYLGEPKDEDYKVLTQKLVFGDTEVSIGWRGANIFFSLINEKERRIPELIIKIPCIAES